MKILIATENTSVETHNAKHNNGCSVGNKLEGCHRCECHIAARNHATVNANERIGVVQLHHQEGGEEHTEQRGKDVDVGQCHCRPHRNGANGHNGERPTTLCNDILNALLCHFSF
ncbi:hypothetical protein HMPREF0653_01792 [Prevotella disiens JCM 6334 = ATCC 29426]|uniref:Uncharacterized protein n=1 Tax=Prevotella disiens JCM 6334 = ATCC 29426 TaxID=1235811 RepID=A0ABN0NQY0_9BACT|nr:hypothetical protein HMPREF0653_01792 [Prevotella disiens JCM 6334 = ATCC 29426]